MTQKFEHYRAADARTTVGFCLSPGDHHDAPVWRALIQHIVPVKRPIALLMDRAYEGDETRRQAQCLGYQPVVPPKSNRRSPWQYDRALYRRRNEIEQLFGRLMAIDESSHGTINWTSSSKQSSCLH